MILYYDFEEELIADFHQFYNLRIEDEFEADIERTAGLIFQLPASSRIMVARHPENSVSVSEYLLRNIEWNTRNAIWMKTKDASSSSPKNRPEPIEFDWERKQKKAEMEKKNSSQALTFAEADLSILLSREGLKPAEIKTEIIQTKD